MRIGIHSKRTICSLWNWFSPTFSHLLIKLLTKLHIIIWFLPIPKFIHGINDHFYQLPAESGNSKDHLWHFKPFSPIPSWIWILIWHQCFWNGKDDWKPGPKAGIVENSAIFQLNLEMEKTPFPRCQTCQQNIIKTCLWYLCQFSQFPPKTRGWELRVLKSKAA